MGMKIVGMKPGEKLNASCDSFVLETDVHYPTDINLLWDAMRKMILSIVFLMCSSRIAWMAQKAITC